MIDFIITSLENMKINKIILRISHFFGLRRGEEHIDDVTVNIPITRYTEKEKEDILYDSSESAEVVADIKKQIFKYFEDDVKLEARCRTTHQVWITFYESIEKEKAGGSLMKMLYYDDGVLYYPIFDRAAYDRNKKLKEVLGS